MNKLIVVARNETTGVALQRFADCIADVQPNMETCSPCVWVGGECGLNTFRELSEQVRGIVMGARGGREHDFVAIVDDVDFGLLNPVGVGSWETIIAMLILAFPEVRWVFANARRTDQFSLTAKTGMPRSDFIGIDSIGRLSFNPIFDGLGLRSFVRAQANKAQANQTEPASEREGLGGLVPVRTKLVAALDDEEDYAFFHAYAAYRSGFRAIALEDLSGAKEIYGDADPLLETALALEDLYLAFPDKPSEYKLSHLGSSKRRQEKFRADILPGLSACNRRVFVTTAHTRERNDGVWSENTVFLESWKKEGVLGTDRTCRFVRKPTRGFFDLKWEAGLPDMAGWPPTEMESSMDMGSRHSAPGQLKEIASCLMERARQIAAEAKSAPGILTAAVLARDALELLSYRTPTLSVEALALLHELEVRAECEFTGVQHHFQVKPRLDELEREAVAMSQWAECSMRKVVAWNAQAAVLTRIVKIFRENGQFDEEQECIVRLRELNRRLIVRQKPWLLAAVPFMWYLEFLLRSLGHFFAAIAGCLFVLTAIFGLNELLGKGEFGLSCWLAFQTFFSVQPPGELTGLTNWACVWVGFGMVLGFFHLGVFISHLYSILSRK